MAQLERTRRITVHEHAFNCHGVRPLLGHNLRNGSEYHSQTRREITFDTIDRAAGNIGSRIALAVQHAETCQA
jgi:hypothetical protein